MKLRPLILPPLLAALISGCGGTSATEPVPRPGPPKEPAPAASLSTFATAAQAASPRPLSESPFSVVAIVDDTQQTGELRVIGVGGAGFILGMAKLIKIEDKGFLRDGSLDKGLPGNWIIYVADLIGRWPDALFADVIKSNGRVGAGELYRWGGGAWQPLAAALPPSSFYVGISPWSEGRTLALSRNNMAFRVRPDVRFALVNGPPAKLPEFTRVKLPPDPTKPGIEPCSLALDPVAFLALPSGHVFTAGHPCDDERHWVVEWWAPGKTKSTTVVLTPEYLSESPYDDTPAFYARSAEDVYLLGGPRVKGPLLYHFDGGSWKSVKVPVDSALSAISGLPDGTIFLAAADTGQVLRRAPDGVFIAMNLPILRGEERMSPTGVWANRADEVWVTTSDAVLRTGAPPGFAVEVLKTDERPPLPGGGKPAVVRAATPSCKTVFALLYTLARTAPDDFDFPQTRAGLKGQTAFKDVRFVETEDRGRRYFGAFVPSYEVGIALVDTIIRKVPGSAPQLLCAEPKVRRTLKIDLRTGDLIK